MTLRTYTSGDLTALLASALGVVQADVVVRAALGRLKLPPPEERPSLTEEDARRVLGDVAGQVGLVGITGRVALSRLGRGGGSSPREPSSRKRRPLAVVAKLLAAAVGDERSTQVVEEAAARLSIGASGDVDIGEALAILESLAGGGGVIGAAARFAKSRIYLSW